MSRTSKVNSSVNVEEQVVVEVVATPVAAEPKWFDSADVSSVTYQSFETLGSIAKAMKVFATDDAKSIVVDAAAGFRAGWNS